MELRRKRILFFCLNAISILCLVWLGRGQTYPHLRHMAVSESHAYDSDGHGQAQEVWTFAFDKSAKAVLAVAREDMPTFAEKDWKDSFVLSGSAFPTSGITIYQSPDGSVTATCIEALSPLREFWIRATHVGDDPFPSNEQQKM